MPRHFGLLARPVEIDTRRPTVARSLMKLVVNAAHATVFRFKVLLGWRFR